MKPEEFLKGGEMTVLTADEFVGDSGFTVLDQDTIKQPKSTKPKLVQFATGVAKSTITPLVNVGKGIANQTVGRAINAIQGEGFKPTKDNNPAVDALNEKSQSRLETAGKISGDIVSLAIPSGAVSKATKSLGFIGKTAARAGTSGAIVSAQEGEVGTGTGIAVGTEAILPGASKLTGIVLAPVKRLIKSLASGLSGVSSKAIESIVAEPSVAKQIAKEVDVSGVSNVIKKNAETIINGVSKVRQDARKAYGEAIGALKAEDIKPDVFRKSVSETLDKYGSVVKNGTRTLTNAEFENPTLIKKANALVNKLSTTPLDGLSLNRLQNEINNAAFKTTGSDAERLAFNAFVKDLSSSVRKAINQSTDKLKDINKAYSTDLQLTEAIEGIFGGVEFKSLDEVRKVSQQLETLFNKKGISPEIIDDFLTKIGAKPSEFRASEAVRQITDVGEKANPVGLTLSEVMRGLTSSIVTPKIVRDVSVLTGLTEQALLPVLEKLAPAARATFIDLILQGKDN
ncbi:MAG: hypothetical protein WC648_01270 [Candidatus Paceibacterota bacterium]|jgi:hypothetical protein